MLRYCFKGITPSFRYFQKPIRPPRVINGKEYPVTDQQQPPKYYYKAPYIEDHWPQMRGGFPSHDHHVNPFLDEARKSQDMWEFQYTYQWYENPNDKKSGINYSPIWTLTPAFLLLMIYNSLKKSQQIRRDNKIDSDMWPQGRRQIQTGFEIQH